METIFIHRKIEKVSQFFTSKAFQPKQFFVSNFSRVSLCWVLPIFASFAKCNFLFVNFLRSFQFQRTKTFNPSILIIQADVSDVEHKFYTLSFTPNKVFTLSVLLNLIQLKIVKLCNRRGPEPFLL